MRPINTYEATGMFISIGVMAVALGLLRFHGTPTDSVPTATEQGAVVVVSENDEEKKPDLTEAITDAVSGTGELTKLIIDDIRAGTGAKVQKGDTVTVHYMGTLRDGTQFDSSYTRGEPFTFTVGEGRVIAGWEEGLIGMQVTGQRVLVIPPDMAYGNRQVGIIPAQSPLIFAIELLSIE